MTVKFFALRSSVTPIMDFPSYYIFHQLSGIHWSRRTLMIWNNIIVRFWGCIIWKWFAASLVKLFTVLQTDVSLEHALSSMVIPGVLPTYPPGNKFPCELIQLALVCVCKVLRLRHVFWLFLYYFLTLEFLFWKYRWTISSRLGSSFPSKSLSSKSIVFRYSSFLAAIARDLLFVECIKKIQFNYIFHCLQV